MKAQSSSSGGKSGRVVPAKAMKKTAKAVKKAMAVQKAKNYRTPQGR